MHHISLVISSRAACSAIAGAFLVHPFPLFAALSLVLSRCPQPHRQPCAWIACTVCNVHAHTNPHNLELRNGGPQGAAPVPIRSTFPIPVPRSRPPGALSISIAVTIAISATLTFTCRRLPTRSRWATADTTRASESTHRWASRASWTQTHVRRATCTDNMKT